MADTDGQNEADHTSQRATKLFSIRVFQKPPDETIESCFVVGVGTHPTGVYLRLANRLQHVGSYPFHEEGWSRTGAGKVVNWPYANQYLIQTVLVVQAGTRPVGGLTAMPTVGRQPRLDSGDPFPGVHAQSSDPDSGVFAELRIVR